jgi:hypothetical protein
MHVLDLRAIVRHNLINLPTDGPFTYSNKTYVHKYIFVRGFVVMIV